MARTRIKSSDIEDLTISTEDIADNSISNDKLVGIEASKLTGTIDGARLPDPLPAMDGSALINVPIDTVNSGTGGQVVGLDGNGDLSFMDIVTDPSLGGDLSGTASNAQINSGAIDNSKILSVDASKIFGTLPFGITGSGTLGSLHKTGWTDDEKVTINLTNSATGIGNAVVRVYEEFNNPANQNLVANNWDLITGNNIGGAFNLNNYGKGVNSSITPQATTGTGVDFVFNGTGWDQSGFSGGSYTSGLFYTIKNSNGNGIAKIVSTSGNIATCDIIEDFPNTNELSQPIITNGEFIDGKFQLSSKVTISSTPSVHAGMVDVTPSSNDIQHYSNIVAIDDTRALVVWAGTDGTLSANDAGVAIVRTGIENGSTIVKDTPHNNGNMNFVEGIFGSNAYKEIVVCKLTEERFIAAGIHSDSNPTSVNFVAVFIPSASTENQTPIIQGTNAAGGPSPHNNTEVRDVRLARISDTRFMAVYSILSSEGPLNNNWVPAYAMFEVASNGDISQLAHHNLLDSTSSGNVGDGSIAAAAGDPVPGTPIFQIFGANDPNLTVLSGVYIYYKQSDGKPTFIQTQIARNTGSANGPSSVYLYQGIDNFGQFRDSNNISIDSVCNRVPQPNKHCLIPFVRSDNQDLCAVYMWLDSVLGIQAAVMRIGIDISGNLNNIQNSSKPLWFGDYSSQYRSQKGGPATIVSVDQCTSITGTLHSTGSFSSSDTMWGLYSYKLDGVDTIKQGVFSGGDDFSTFGGTNLNIVPQSMDITTTGLVDKIASTTLGVHDHTQGQAMDLLQNYSIVIYKHGDNHMYAKTVSYSSVSQDYVNGEWTTTISGTDTIDTTNYGLINAISTVQTHSDINDVSYAFATDIDQDSGGEIIAGTFFITLVTPTGPFGLRNILTTRNSVHGQTEGAWYYNSGTSGADAWTEIVIDSNDFIGPAGAGTSISATLAYAQTLKVSDGLNRLTRTNIEQTNTFGNWPALTSKFAVAIGIKTSNSTQSPKVDKVLINYSTNAVHRDKTFEYIIDIVDVDTIEVTAPSSGGPRNARVYVTS